MDSELFSSIKDEYFLDLHVSASIGCEERVRDIVENAENKQILNKLNKCSWTPLMYAASSTNLTILSFLLEEGAEPDMCNSLGQTALILASKCGSTDTVSRLIDFKANVNIKDIRGWSAIFYAAAFGHRSIVQLLIEKRAVVDMVDKNDGFNPLMLSSAAGHEIIVKDLLHFGLNPALKSKTGDTARSLAVKHGHQNVKSLIDKFSYSKKNYSPFPQLKQDYPPKSELLTLLQDLQLSKYYYIFESHDIDINTFWTLNDEELKDIGINLLGPRKKMCLAISKYHNSPKRLPEDKNLSILLLEKKKLQQEIEKLEMDLTHQIESRNYADKRLNEGILSLKNFIGNVHGTMRYALNVQEKIRLSLSNLKQMIHSTPNISIEQYKREVIFPEIERFEGLIDEMRCQILLAVQHTDFVI